MTATTLTLGARPASHGLRTRNPKQKQKQKPTTQKMTDLFFALIFLVAACLAVAAIIMPIVVILIDTKVAKIQKSLADMQHMMRHGK